MIATSILGIRNVSEMAHLGEYLILIFVSFAASLLVYEFVLDVRSTISISAVLVATFLATLMGVVSQYYTSTGYFHISRTSHIYQSIFMIIAFSLIWLGDLGAPIGFDWLVVFCIFLGLICYTYAGSKFGIFKTQHDKSRLSIPAIFSIYVISSTPVMLNNYAQILFIQQSDIADYSLLDIRISFYISAILLLPLGFIVGEKKGRMKSSKILPLTLLGIALICSVFSSNLYAPYVFAIGVVMIRYASRSIVVAISSKHLP